MTQAMWTAKLVYRADTFDEADRLYELMHDALCDATTNGKGGDDHLCALDVGTLGPWEEPAA